MQNGPSKNRQILPELDQIIEIAFIASRRLYVLCVSVLNTLSAKICDLR